MEYRDYYSGLYRDYCRDPFPHSLLSTRELHWHVITTLTLKVANRVCGPKLAFQGLRA